MNSKHNYNTKQKNLIQELLAESINQHLTVSMIVNQLQGKVGQTTVYRILEKMISEGTVIKYESPRRSSSCYQYIGIKEKANIFHLLCVDCGRILHTECENIFNLSEHMRVEHCFTVDNRKLVLYGYCEQCGKTKFSETSAL